MTDKFQLGLANRREVMGDEFVDRAFDNASEFTRPLQDLVTSNCWGESWPDETLTKGTRSLLTISMLTALRASTELKGHVRGALRNGCSVEEIQATLLHATAYCGFPAGVEAFRAADEVIQSWKEGEA
ncbi:MAG: carboxymuconolactone decarboxylase family protein [Pseudomonadota bacterium]